MKDKGNITGPASIIGLLTLLSRILGYMRDAVIAYIFGAGMHADSFFVAFRVSNLLRRLVGEGALTSSFIPIFTGELRSRTRAEARELVSRVFTLFFVILVILALLGVLFSDTLVWLMAPGFAEVPGKFELTVTLTRLMFPYMVFIGLMAIAMGVLNSMKHFTAPALSPVMFNISVIFSAVALVPLLKEPVYALAAGVLVGGALQFFMQLPYLRKYGMAPRLVMSPAGLSDPAIKKIFLLMGPALLGVGVYQLNIFVTMRFASGLGEGSISYLFYASRLMELPLGVFGVAIATAVLPSLSEYVEKQDFTSFRDSLSFSLRMMNFVMIPATFGLFILSLPIIEVLFMRGEFGGEASAGTAFALYFYALGLVPVASSRILVSVFYSLKDTATPVRVALVCFLFNIVMCFLLIGPLKHGGLALATSLAAALNLGLLVVILKRRFGNLGGMAVLTSAIRNTIASAVMGGLILAVIVTLDWQTLGTALKAVVLFGCVGAGIVIYVVISMAFKSPEVSFLKGIIEEKVGKKGEKKVSNDKSPEP
ncbi:MAG: murein biosynthesis integral membrane protein MurJ [Thermodesulfobacteriota bacterium]